MFNKFSEETKKVLSLAKKEMVELKHPYLGSEHLLLGILKNNNNVTFLLKKYNVTYKRYKDAVIQLVGIGDKKAEWILYTPIVKEIFERAIDISSDSNSDVTIDNLFIALIEIGDGIANRVLNNLQVNMEKLYTEFVFKIPKKNKKKKTIIDEIGIEFTDPTMVARFDPVIGRDKEINQIIEILVRKNKSNPLLIGDAGVGKTAIIEEISKMIVNNKVPNKLKNKRIINLDMSSAVAGTKYRGEFEDKINKIIKEAETDNDIILFIDEIHTIVGAGGAEGAIDASNIFKPALARGNIKCIGATTLDEYKKYIEKDKALERRFKKVIIEEPDYKNVKNIIYKLKPIYENYHHVTIKNNVLDLIIDLTNKYIRNYKNPDKTIDILDEVCAHANLKENDEMKEYNELTEELTSIIKTKKEKIECSDFKSAFKYKQRENEITSKLNELEYLLTTTHYNFVTKHDLAHVLKNKVNIPIIELNDRFNRGEIIKKLKNKVIGQDHAIKKLVSSYFANIENNEVFSVLLNGPSGVGKTSLALEFANALSNKVLRIDMSEFSEAHSVSKLVGAPPGYVGYDNSNYLFDSIREYPFTIIILDEIERCHPAVLNLFFQILDNNQLKDAKGNVIYFNNTIIIMTTNVEKNKNLGFNNCQVNSQLNDYFTIPFINRIKEIITLDSLSEEIMTEIIRKELSLSHKNITIDSNKFKKILDESSYKEYGARKIKSIVSKIPSLKKRKKSIKNYSKN